MPSLDRGDLKYPEPYYLLSGLPERSKDIALDNKPSSVQVRSRPLPGRNIRSWWPIRLLSILVSRHWLVKPDGIWEYLNMGLYIWFLTIVLGKPSYDCTYP